MRKVKKGVIRNGLKKDLYEYYKRLVKPDRHDIVNQCYEIDESLSIDK